MKKYWVDKDNKTYELHFIPYKKDEIILKFCQDEANSNCFWYVSDMLKVEEDCIYANSVEDAKEDFEYKISEFFQDKINYYDELLEKFEEE